MFLQQSLVVVKQPGQPGLHSVNLAFSMNDQSYQACDVVFGGNLQFRVVLRRFTPS